MKTPSTGRVVLAVGGKAFTNGSDTAPAVITRIWSPDPEGRRWCVNATVLPDATPEVRVVTSAYLYDDEPAARAALQNESMTALYWPPLV